MSRDLPSRQARLRRILWGSLPCHSRLAMRVTLSNSRSLNSLRSLGLTRKGGSLGGNEGADALSGNDAEDIATLVHVEDDHGHRVVLAKADGGHIHDLEAALQDFEIRDLIVLDGVFDEDGVGTVDAVDLGGLE